MAFTEQRRSGDVAYKHTFRIAAIQGSIVRILWEGDDMGEAETLAEKYAVEARANGSPETIVLDGFRLTVEKRWIQRLFMSRPPSAIPIRRSEGQRGRPRILFLPMEFPTWTNGAHSWSYAAALAYETGLREAGCEVTTINTAVAPHQHKVLRGKRFDQVWFHCHPKHIDDFAFRQWISDIAPVRLMLCGETLQYAEADALSSPWLPAHGLTYERWEPHVTHVAFVDPADAERTAARTSKVRAMWWQQAVPRSSVLAVNAHPRRETAAFIGTLYPPRDRWAWDLAGLLERLECPESDLFQWLFERSHEWIQRTLDRMPDVSGLGPGPAPAYPHAWRVDLALKLYNRMQTAMRRYAFGNFITALRDSLAVVNLPSQVRTYGGRVYEGMAAGRPVITQRLPGHDVFADGVDGELLHYTTVEELGEHIRWIQRNRSQASAIAARARAALLAKHTVEHRTRQLLDFVEGRDA